MDDRTREAAAAAIVAARELLQGYKGEHPGWTDDRTPVGDLVSWLGLEVETFHPNDYPQGTYGFLEPGEDLIWLCRDLSSSLHRFTLAHELGHAVLHRDADYGKQWSRVGTSRVGTSPTPTFQGVPELSREDPCQQPDVQEEVAGQSEQELWQEVLGIGQAYDPRSERERAANIFAAELLMPLERVRTLYLDQHIPPNQLASIFEVSNAAMLNRLAGLLTDSATAEQPTTRRPQGSSLLWTNDAPAEHENDEDAKQGDGAEEAKPDHGRGDPLWSPGDGARTSPRKQYDEFQRAAIEAATPALIVAGPGSGKTSTLIGRAEYLIDKLDVQPEHILALTFSRKAAQEMEERLRLVLHSHDRVREETAQGIPMPMVSTFHAFCADILRTYGGRVGLRPDFALIDETEGYFLLRQLAREMQLSQYRNLASPAYYFPDFLKAISRAKDELATPEQYQQLAQRMLEQAHDEESELSAKKALEVASIYRLYQEGLRRRGDTDFGGLVMLAVQLLEEFPEVRYEQRQRFSHILVDEFQDINRASGVLLRLLAGDERCVWVVGDANQAIYGFRGASPANIGNFQADYPGAVVLPLSCNYRSRPDIVDLAESFRGQQLDAQSEPGQNQPVRPTQPDTYVTLAVAADNAGELEGLVADIRSRLAQGYGYKDIVVLCRRRAQARKITRALALAGLPVIEQGGILGQPHIKDLISIVLLLAEPSGMGILRAAQQSEHAFSQSDIESLLLAAREQRRQAGDLIVGDEAPASMSIDGRRSLRRLSKILQAMWQYAPNVWSLLAQYLFIETSIMRELLRKSTDKEKDLASADLVTCPPDRVPARGATTFLDDDLVTCPPDRVPTRDYLSPRQGPTTFIADYTGFLQLARRYDQQQQALRIQQEREAEERGEKAAPLPTIQEQARGFLDYLNVMLTLGQDGGGDRQQSVGGPGEERPDVIRVMTVHASKGLEFPVVYLPGLIQRNFPLQARSNPVPAPVGMLPAESEGSAAHETGEACLFYVGVTRARDHLVLSYSERNGKQKAKPSVYLDALVAGLPDERVTRLSWQGGAEIPTGAAEDTEVVASSQPSSSFIDAMKPTTLKVADIETYQRCPRKYMYGSIYGLRSEEGSYQLFWQAAQKTLETLQKKLAEANGPDEPDGQGGQERLTQEVARAFYTQYWQELGGQALPFAAIYEQHGHEVTELMRRKLLESGDINWELRPNFTVEVAGKTIHITVDRVERSPQGEKPVRFVRARFGKRKEKPAVGTRELLYARAYREHQQHQQGQSVELHFHNLSTGETFPITLTTKKEQSLIDELEQSILALERNEYPAIPDAFLCPSCPFFLICPA
ncbi:MAG: UvrD-helicase domain-containing protein [Ktedonobacteraceae bacterium]